jgi:hypothetical protein
MRRREQGRTPSAWCLVILTVVLVACGGGQGADDPKGDTGVDPGGGGDPGAGDPMGVVMPPFDATTLTGGVLATFQVGPDQFRGWFTRQEATDRLVASFTGTAAPVTSICTRIRLGPGEQGHNAPWSWSVDTLLPPDLDGNCAACASSWPTPPIVEAGMSSSMPFNCTITGPVGGMESRAFMQCTLIDVIDRR